MNAAQVAWQGRTRMNVRELARLPWFPRCVARMNPAFRRSPLTRCDRQRSKRQASNFLKTTGTAPACGQESRSQLRPPGVQGRRATEARLAARGKREGVDRALAGSRAPARDKASESGNYSVAKELKSNDRADFREKAETEFLELLRKRRGLDLTISCNGDTGP